MKNSMEDVMNEISRLSDSELRQHLIERGESVGPILHSLRKLFLRKLAKHILRERGINPDDDDDPSNKESSCDGGNWVGSVAVPGASRPSGISHVVDDDCSKPRNNNAADGQDPGSDTVYFSISLPAVMSGNLSVPSGDDLVFRDKANALKLMKEFKGSRFKVFKDKEDALRFCHVPAEEICPSPRRPLPQDHIPPAKSGLTEEKCSFKEPSRAERINLMKLIEVGEAEEVKRILWNNPRIVISNGDTPVILHEAFRYNALHIAAKFNQAAICQIYIDTIEDEAFLKLMFPTDTHETTTSRINFLLDLYLNMPEKGVFDGVLHTASKYGSLATIKILAAHPQTDLNLRNRYNETAADVICRRARVTSAHLKDEILAILTSNVYVPLLRTEDNTEAPYVGKPWSPDARVKGNQELSVGDVWDSDTVPLGDFSPAAGHSPLSRTPKDAKLKVKAYAGPMSPTQADKFYKKWQSCPVRSPHHVKLKYHELKRGDMEKGLERLGRDLARDLHVPWTEHWDFLNSFIDLASPAGLKHLEDFLRGRAQKQCQHLNFGGENNNVEKITDGSFCVTTASDSCDKCLCSTLDSFDESLEERLSGGHSLCMKCGGRIEFKNGAENISSDLSQISDSAQDSSLGSLVEQMGNLKMNCSSEETGESHSKMPIFGYLSRTVDGNGANSDDLDSDDEEFFESSGILENEVDKISENVASMSQISKESDTLKSDRVCVIPILQDTDKSSRWSVMGVLRNAFAGLKIFSPKQKGIKAAEQNLETSPGLEIEENPKITSPDDDIFVDAEDSIVAEDEICSAARVQVDSRVSEDEICADSRVHVDSMAAEEEICAASSDKELCSTPKCGYSDSPRFHEQQIGSMLFPGRLQRIFIDGNQPTKLDLDVLRAVEVVGLDPDLYPFTAKWKETVTQFSMNEQSRWPSPASVRRKSRLLTPLGQPRTVFQTTPKTGHSEDEVVSRLQF
ncbi:ankyrin repeat and LEM domain-containing protein 2-like isoform X2 [Lineus longissimus]|uniref:ankyrin repeat and LEM domain-containing protein 2-like isoform X2 n=1 Tax=Lineus longissimus TaxID=88925 RepID=UPI00315DD589